MMKYLLTALLLYTTQNAYANRAVMEAIPTSNDGVFVSTTVPQLLLNGATFYSGGVSPVGLRSSSNVVVGADNIVLYSTGSVTANSLSIAGSTLTVSKGVSSFGTNALTPNTWFYDDYSHSIDLAGMIQCGTSAGATVGGKNGGCAMLSASDQQAFAMSGFGTGSSIMMGNGIISISSTVPVNPSVNYRSMYTTFNGYSGVEAYNDGTSGIGPGGRVNVYASTVQSPGSGVVITPTPTAVFLPHGHVEYSNSGVPGVNCSGGGSVSIVGNDGVGRITIGTASTTCAITFTSAWTNAPVCIPTTSGALTPRQSASSTASSTFTFTSGTGTIGYVCFGYQ